MVRLETAELDRFGPLKSCHPDCSEGITVIAGPNESGKSLYLEGILQLLDPRVMDHMDPDPRVDGSPSGRVVVTAGSEQHTLGDGTALSDISPIEPINLHNLFVVRDSDLQLPDGTNYYTRLVERLGDIHTTDINRIRRELVDEGRLTKSHLNFANREHDTKEVRKATDSLIGDIKEYLDSISADGVREVNRERLRKRRELETVREQLATQKIAKRLNDLEFARDQLTIYREMTVDLQELGPFDRDSLTDLRELNQDISRDEDEQSRLSEQISEKKDERDERTQILADTRSNLEELQQRESDVEAVEEALEEYRRQKADGEGYDAKLSQYRAVTLVGLAGAAITGGIGAAVGSTTAIGLGFPLLLIGLAGWYLHRQATQSISDTAAQERELIEAARDAGFSIEGPDDIAPTIRNYRDKLDGTRERRQRLEAELDATDDRISELNDELRKVTERVDGNRNELASKLAQADVDDIAEFEARVKEREEKEDKRSGAERDLRREIGDAGSEDPEAKLAFWQTELSNREAGIEDADVDANDFSESTLEELNQRETELSARLKDLNDELSEFEESVRNFERQATELNTSPFVEEDPTLHARTVEGLETLAADLRGVVDAIERNAEISRKAINILDEIRDEEQQKIATLFDPEGPASSTLSKITDGRYESVDYDPDMESLEVTTTDGQTFTPHQLSRGTQDQLFLAARLSLAQQILGSRSGFLILDDPFLAADSTRLRRGFEILTDLTTEGWQIIYMTAKREVRKAIADEFELPVFELETLDS